MRNALQPASNTDLATLVSASAEAFTLPMKIAPYFRTIAVDCLCRKSFLQNLYRLLKTALQKDVRERMFGEGGAYRALIVQLAIVTAAPEAAPYYFARLASLESGTTLQSLLDALIADEV